MKKSIRNQFKYLFERAPIPDDAFIDVIGKQSFESVIEADLKKQTVEFDVNVLEEDIDGNIKTSYTQKCEMSKYSVLCYAYYCHKHLEGFSLNENELESVITEGVTIENVFENDSSLTSPEDFLAQNYEEITARKSEVVTKVVNSSSLDEFKKNIFYFLYKKFYKPSIKLKANSPALSESINDIIDMFINKLKDNSQTALTVNFGAFFEEVFRENIYKALGKRKQFSVDLNHSSKKVAIVLLFCCNKIFDDINNQGKTSAVYFKLLRGQKPNNSDYIEDYRNIRYEDDQDKVLEKQTFELVNKYIDLLQLNKSSTYCDDFEVDDKFSSVSPSNSPFDFIIRENDITSSNCHVGLFDLKATNTSSGSQPIKKGATGSNGGTYNTALTFVKDFTNHLKKLNSNNIGIGFFGLVQISYKLDFSSHTDFEISLGELKSIEMNALSSCNYSIDKDHFYLSNGSIEKDINLSISSIDPDQVVTRFNDFDVVKKAKNKSIFEDLTTKYNSLRKNVYDYLNSYNENSPSIGKFISMIDFVFIPAYFNVILKIKTLDFSVIAREFNTTDSDTVEKIKNDKFVNPLALLELLSLINIGTYSTNDLVTQQEFLDTQNSVYNNIKKTAQQNAKRSMFRAIIRVFGNTNEKGNIESLIRDEWEGGNSSTPNINSIAIRLSKQNPAIKADDVVDIIRNEIDNASEHSFEVLSRYNQLKIPYGTTFNDNLDNSGIERFSPMSKNILGLDDSQLENKELKGKLLKEVYSHLFKRKVINEGGLGGHMMHPYEAVDMTPRQIIDRVKEYSASQSIIEKVDGQNLFFTVEQDGTLMFARNKEDMTHDDLVAKFTNHGAEVPFVEGGNAIKSGVEQWLQSAGQFAEQEIEEIFHPGGDTKSFINFEIMHPAHENLIVYDEKYIVLHSIVDYVDGREKIFSSNKSQRLQDLVKRMQSGVSSAGFTLASNRTVDLNQLSNVQIEDYVSRINEVTQLLEITEDEFLGDGIEKLIEKEIDELGVSISEKDLRILYDFVLYGETKAGVKIKSKDFTSSVQKHDLPKLRSIDLTSAAKALQKVQRIISPFKEIFVDLGIDLLKGVKSAYMSDATNQMNIDLLKDKLQTAVDDLSIYMSEIPESEWPKEVYRLNPHLDKVMNKGIENIVSTAVEGGVYDYQGDLLKVTGGFAPMNQILGAAYRDKKGIFPTFKEKFMKRESIRRSLKDTYKVLF
jgi:hypothetical protein